MKFNLELYGFLHGEKDMFLYAVDSYVVNVREQGRGERSYFVFHSEAAGNDFAFWRKDLMKDYRRLRSDHVLLHLPEFQYRDKLRDVFFLRAKSFAMRWGFHMIPVEMRLAMDYASNEINEPTLVWPSIPLVGKHGEVEDAEEHDEVGRPL